MSSSLPAPQGRGGRAGETLVQLASTRTTSTQQRKPHRPRNLSSSSSAAATQHAPAEEEQPSPPAPPIGPLGESIFLALTLSMLHLTLTVLVHQQYLQEIIWREVLIRSVFVGFPSLLLIIHTTHITLHRTPLGPLGAHLLLGIASVATGCRLVHVCNRDAYYAVMKSAPPLGVLWVWTVVELPLPAALLAGLVVLAWFWGGGYSV